MKKIIFFEPEVKSGVGHHLDNLIQDAYFLQKNKKIIGVLNKEFKKKNLFIPKFIELIPIIITLNNNLLINIKYFFYFVKKLIFFLYYFKKKNKLFIFLKTCILNYFSIPIYFFSFYEKFKQINLNEKDHLLIQSCRPKDIELIFFLCSVETNIPNIHIKLHYPPKKKKLKNFFFYANKIIKLSNTINKFFIYSSFINIKNIVESDKKLTCEISTPIYDSYNRKNIISNSNKELTLGFLGASRNEKGFNKLPDLLSEIYKKKSNFKFIIQLSNTIYPDTEKTRKLIIDLAKNNKKIIIHHGYLDFLNWRKLLKKINIIPIIYNKSYTDSVASGLFYSCVSNEIPMVIPKKTLFMKNLLFFKGFLEAETINEYSEQLYKIYYNYKYYLKEMKKESRNYKILLKQDPLLNRINK